MSHLRDACGLNNRIKRKRLFKQILRDKFNLFLLQETYSTPEGITLWENEWGGKIFASHGRSNSRGVAILMNPVFKNVVEVIGNDSELRWIMIRIKLQDTGQEIVSMNLYAPNVDTLVFYEQALGKLIQSQGGNFIIGGDFNLVMNKELACKNRKTNNDKLAHLLDDFMENENVADPFRCLYLEAK